jgi:F-type H+-transporting ATP synthase subunit e
LIRQAKEQWARDHPTAQPKSSGGTSGCESLTEAVETKQTVPAWRLTGPTANADPKDPNADYHALLGITDK